MNTIKVNSKNTLMIAHRGMSGIELENTNAAFIAAGNRSHFGIETDVHKTADGNISSFTMTARAEWQRRIFPLKAVILIRFAI